MSRRLSQMISVPVRLSMMAAVVALVISCSAPAEVRPGKEIRTDGGSYRSVTAAQLKSMLEKEDIVLVNVHTPYEGEIKETDFFIVYDQIEPNAFKLAENKNASIALYCRVGVMSAQAAETLVKMGYTNVYELEGGLIAWQDQGYPIDRHDPCAC